MGCFLACFGGDKDQTQRKRSRKSLPRAKESYKPLLRSRSPSPKKLTTEVANVSIPQLRENREQGSIGGCRKKVTFDLNVKTYEDVVIHEESQHQLEEEEGKEAVKEEENEEESEGKATAITGAYPANHRYQNSAGSDDEDVIDDSDDSEYGEYEDDDCDFDEEDDNALIVGTEEESYDSFFSLPLESEKQSNCQEVSSPIPVSVAAKRHARDRSQYVHSVLNPVQNLSEWKEVKVRAVAGRNTNKENVNSEKGNKMFSFEPELIKNTDKENIKAEQESKMIVFTLEPAEKLFDRYQTSSFSTKEEISVDASLSTWLVSSENLTKEKRPQESSNSPGSNSLVSREERPILGALTVDDIKQSSVTSSPRRSPSKSPDDIPILGTMGSYWNHKAHNEIKNIPNTTNKYREDKRVNWNSTPFEARLERALNKGAAEACPR